MTEYRKAFRHEEADILDFINYVFSQAHRPHDFKRLLPKVYAHEGFYRWHYVAVENGRIRGTVAVLPVEMPFGEGQSLKIGYVGSVSAHPYDKGAGHMKKLMQLMLEDTKDQYDLLALGGRRQRYQYFGFECGGARLRAKKVLLGMHMTQPLTICSSGNLYMTHNPLCLVESTAYPVKFFGE